MFTLLRIKHLFLGGLATVAFSVFTQSIGNCCFLATYEPEMPAELKKIISK